MNGLVIEVRAEGNLGFAVMVEVRQGTITMNEPSKQFQRLILKGQLRHGGNPILRWMARNVTVKPDPKDTIMPRKPRAAAKIDGIVASIIALLRAKTAAVEQEHESRAIVI